MAENDKAVFRIVIAGSMEAIFRELTKTGSPQGAVFNSMLTLVETGRPPLGSRLMYVAFGALESVLPTRTKSEKWPL